jgi:type II secretory pathway pseudopilin PulG
MLVVIAIISILMTAGSVGLSGLGGKGVTSGVATAESLFDEARTTAVGRNLRACVLVAKTLDNNPAEDLRRMVVAYEETNADGTAKSPNSQNPNWQLSSRGALLPDQTFFSEKYSKGKDEDGNSKSLDEIPSSQIVGAKKTYQGEYFIYRFNSQGISLNPGASFIIGTGARVASKSSTAAPPRTTASSKRDFGGFVVWRNGRTSLYRSPEQMGIQSFTSNSPF